MFINISSKLRTQAKKSNFKCGWQRLEKELISRKTYEKVEKNLHTV